MDGLLAFTNVADAMSKGRTAVKGNFTLEDGTEGNEEERNYTRTFNSQWNAKAQPVAGQLSKFLAACYRAEGLSVPELKVDPGLSTTQEIVNCWRLITMSLHPEFVRQVTGVTEKIFSSPDIEQELSAQVRKKCHEVQLSVFNKLQSAAMLKLEELDEFVGLQVDV